MSKLRAIMQVRSDAMIFFTFFIVTSFSVLLPFPVQARCTSGTVKCYCYCSYKHGLARTSFIEVGSRDIDTKHKKWWGGACIPTKGVRHVLGLCKDWYCAKCKDICTNWRKEGEFDHAVYHMLVRDDKNVDFDGNGLTDICGVLE